MELLLLSTSTLFDEPFLDYALNPVEEWLGEAKDVVFIPYALKDWDGYSNRVAEKFSVLGVKVYGIHQLKNPLSVLLETKRVFVGGGNTFRLLKTLQDKGMVQPLNKYVTNGTLRYLGSSAGTNIAGATIRTTNDMPIVQPSSFGALRLLPFQINPHFLDPIPNHAHMGESRETRITEFLEENNCPVVGLREGSWLRFSSDKLTLLGGTARLFERGKTPTELASHTNLTFLMESYTKFDNPL